MQIASLNNLDETLQRHRAFWEMSPCDRPLAMIHGTQAQATTDDDDMLEQLSENDPRRYGTDPDILVLRTRQSLRRGVRYGDMLAIPSAPFGPSMLSAFLGAEVHVRRETVWFSPVTDDIATLSDLELDPENQWWKLVQEYCLRVAQRPDGIGAHMLDLGGLGDNLAALIGVERLMFEIVERPKLVKQVLRRMLAVMKTCYERIYRIAEAPGLGTASWLGLWSPGRSGIIQNDMSIMLSTAMYREFFEEEFVEMCEFFDHTSFHLDGTASQRHLDFLLTLPKLHAVQVGSDPETPAMAVLPVLKRIQEQGKRIYVWVNPDEVAELFRHISPRGVCVVIAVANETEACDYLKSLEIARTYRKRWRNH